VPELKETLGGSSQLHFFFANDTGQFTKLYIIDVSKLYIIDIYIYINIYICEMNQRMRDDERLVDQAY